jgi:hypothetical protein
LPQSISLEALPPSAKLHRPGQVRRFPRLYTT